MRNLRVIGNSSLLSGTLVVVMLGLSVNAMAETDVNQGHKVEGYTAKDVTYKALDASNLSANEINLIFIRPLDGDNLQSTANIGIDGRFHVSLQPGDYSQLRYCSGEHNISINPTSLKTNDLTNTYSHLVTLSAQQNHYLQVEVIDTTGGPQLSKLKPSYALQLLNNQNQSEKTNQISRVVADCPPIKPEVESGLVIKADIEKPINLKVFFESDREVVRPVFNQDIETVANFMNKYPDTVSVLEGHTDSKGTESYNLDLSKHRALAVKKELVLKYGIEPNRLGIVGYGEIRPVDTNTTIEGRYNNRRVIARVNVTK